MATKGPPVKEAVVYILDSYPSMNAEYPPSSRSSTKADGTPMTRLEAAKKAIEGMIYRSMLDRKDHLALIIVCKTRKTNHHLMPLDIEHAEMMDPKDLPLPHLTELGPQLRMAPADPNLLRELWETVQPVDSLEEAQKLRGGDFCNALVLAADALFRETHKKRFRRKIVLITDACHDVRLNTEQMRIVIDSLREMECSVHVLGIGFDKMTSCVFDEPLPEENAKQQIVNDEDDEPNTKRVKREEPRNNNQNDDDGDSSEDEHENDDPMDEEKNDDNDDKDEGENPRPDVVESSNNEANIEIYDTVEYREKLLISMTEMTRGSVISVENFQELLNAEVGKKVVKPSATKMQLHAGPGLTVQVKRVKLLSKAALGVKKKEEAVRLDEHGNPKTNSLGREITDPIKTKYREAQYFFNPSLSNTTKDDEVAATQKSTEDHDDEEEPVLMPVKEDEMADSIRYGADLIPMGEQDFAGLKSANDANYPDEEFDTGKSYIDILGYVKRDLIPLQFVSGPPYGVSGFDSLPACTLIAALAQNLQESDQVAVCTVKATAGSNPQLQILCPYEEPMWKGREPTRLIMFGIPFGGEAKPLSMMNFDDILHKDKGQSSDNDNDEKEEYEAQALASDNLVKSLMLPDDALCSDRIRSPFIQSFRQTLLKRAINRGCSEEDLVISRDFGPDDPMSAPPEILDNAKPALEAFRQAFPLKKKKIKKATKKGRGQPVRSHTDFLKEDEEHED